MEISVDKDDCSLEENGWNSDLHVTGQKYDLWSTYSKVNDEILTLEGFLPLYQQREDEMGLTVVEEESSFDGSFLFQGI